MCGDSREVGTPPDVFASGCFAHPTPLLSRTRLTKFSRVARSTLAVLPVRGHVVARLVEVDMLVDMIDPGYRNEMMVLSVRRVLPGQLDLVRPVQVIDLSDGFPVGRNDIHVLLDLRRIRHARSPLIVPELNAASRATFPGRC